MNPSLKCRRKDHQITSKEKEYNNVTDLVPDRLTDRVSSTSYFDNNSSS